MSAGDRAELRRAFDLMNKMQVLAVIPAGAGLAVMVADYLPLLYGAAVFRRRPDCARARRAVVRGNRICRRLAGPVGRRTVSRRPHDSGRDGRRRATLHLDGGAVRPARQRRSCWAGAGSRPRCLGTLKHAGSTAFNFHGGLRRRSPLVSLLMVGVPHRRAHGLADVASSRRSPARSSGSSLSRSA